MTVDLIKQIKEIKGTMVKVELTGEDWEEREAVLEKLEDVTSYLKDMLGRGVEF